MPNRSSWIILGIAVTLSITAATPASAQRRAEVQRDPNTGEITGSLETQGGGQSLEAAVTINPTEMTVEECHLLDTEGHDSGEGCE